jgi:hypothetical protein
VDLVDRDLAHQCRASAARIAATSSAPILAL